MVRNTSRTLLVKIEWFLEAKFLDTPTRSEERRVGKEC